MAAERPHALILARGGSKGIPGKNIKSLNGVPLLVYNVKAALASGVFSRVVVSSDSAEVRAIAVRAGAVAFERDSASATDTASSESGVVDYLDRTPACAVCCLVQCTSPLTGSDDFARGHAAFLDQDADSLVTVVRTHRFLWSVGADGCAAPKNYVPVQRPRRQDWAGELIENGAFYFFKVDAFRAAGNSRLCGRIVAHEMAEETLVEIDSITDWKIVEFLAAEKFGDGPKAWGF
ncbi:nucleotide-diphospho-sugar transferase [Pelagophyceae sp. CCMP2097]|nr:nucleotide-diphospho-sugar transferase [Pelagophyceae sp. CCMP2097]